MAAHSNIQNLHTSEWFAITMQRKQEVKPKHLKFKLCASYGAELPSWKRIPKYTVAYFEMLVH